MGMKLYVTQPSKGRQKYININRIFLTITQVITNWKIISTVRYTDMDAFKLKGNILTGNFMNKLSKK